MVKLPDLGKDHPCPFCGGAGLVYSIPQAAVCCRECGTRRAEIDIARAVSKCGRKLQAVANMAGMSSAEFSQVWREDSIKALSAFVQGLEKPRRGPLLG